MEFCLFSFVWERARPRRKKKKKISEKPWKGSDDLLMIDPSTKDHSDSPPCHDRSSTVYNAATFVIKLLFPSYWTGELVWYKRVVGMAVSPWRNERWESTCTGSYYGSQIDRILRVTLRMRRLSWKGAIQNYHHGTGDMQNKGISRKSRPSVDKTNFHDGYISVQLWLWQYLAGMREK